MRTGAARGQVGNFHEAGFYGSDADFLQLIVPFVAEGLAADEPVVIGYDARKNDLVRSAVPRARDEVTFIEDASLYASPARAIEAYRQQFERHVAAGAGQIRIAGDVPHEGNGGRFAGWDRYESAVNVVWQDYPVWSRCLYDATTVPDAVRDVVERTHRRLVAPTGAAAVPSPRYQEAAEFEGLPSVADPLEATATRVQLTDASLKRTRRIVAEAASEQIAGAALDDLLYAVSEAVINAQQYGRPPSTVKVWTAPGRIVVHIHDSGPGPPDRLTGLVRDPEGFGGAGLGLWLSHQLAHIDIDLVTGVYGFTVRVRAGSPPSGPDGAPYSESFPAGTPEGEPPLAGGVHAMDGDGASCCGEIATGELVALPGLVWSDVPVDQRCSACKFLLELWASG